MIAKDFICYNIAMMDSLLIGQLHATYPLIFKEKIAIECDNGWYSLLDKLCKNIMKISPTNPPYATQVKEKFGGLRFYVQGGQRVADRLVIDAQEKSYSVCEICGKKGKTLMRGIWLKTLCPHHAKEMKYKKIIE